MKKKILYGLIALIILLGIIMYFVHGFNIGNMYGANTKLGLYIETGINLDEVKTIVNESFNGKEAIYQDVEYFGEMLLITLPTVTDEEVDNFLSKINEKYSLDYTKDDLDIMAMPSMSFYEIVKPYLLPLLLSVGIAIVYLAIRYHSLGIGRMIVKPIIAIVLVELIIMSAYLIANIPIDISIVPASLIGLGIAFIYVATDNNKLLEIREKEIEEEENKK